MKQFFIFVLAMPLLVSACGVQKGLEVSEAWARPAAQSENGAIYFVIQNHGREADELISVSSEVADAIEMHESKMDGDVMQMQRLESVPLPANETVMFKPGGLHVMLIGLKKDLKVGDEIEVTLHFKNFEDINLLVPVREATASEGVH